MIADFVAPAPVAAAVAVLAPVLGVAGRLGTRAQASVARWIGVASATAVLAASIMLAWAAPFADAVLRVDRVAALGSLLVAGVAAVAAWSGGILRLRELACLAALMVALLADSAAATWLGVHAAVVATARPGLAARLPALIGSAVALCGTMLLAFGAGPIQEGWAGGLRWSALAQGAAASDGALLAIATALLVVGYGMAALHAPPATMPALGVLAVVLVVLLRLRTLLASNPAAAAVGPLLIVAGLSVVAVAALALWTRAGGSAGHAVAGQAGVALTAFGVGGPEAIAAGLLHLTMLMLVGAVALRGEGRTGVVGVAALRMLPPSGLFASAAVILAVMARVQPWLVVPLAAGLVALAIPLAPARVDGAAGTSGTGAASIPAWIALALATVLGFAMPASVAGWLQAAAASLP